VDDHDSYAALVEDRNPARVFGEVAGDYDRVRPACPAALFDDVLSYSQPDIGGRRADALGDGATLALFWNNERIAEPALRTAMLRVFARHAPSVVVNDEPLTSGQVWQRWPGDELSTLAAFESLASHHYRCQRNMPAVDYLGLTRTRSQFRMLPPSIRRDLLAALTRLFGDEVPLVIHTTLLLARRRQR